MQGGFQHFHYIIGSDLTLFASNHTGTRLIHHRKPSGHQLPAALSLFARCWLNLATLLSVLKAFTAILYCTEIQYLLKYGRRSILFATATASMRAQSGPYLGVLDLTRTERHSSVLCVVWAGTPTSAAMPPPGLSRLRCPPLSTPCPLRSSRPATAVSSGSCCAAAGVSSLPPVA